MGYNNTRFVAKMCGSGEDDDDDDSGDCHSLRERLADGASADDGAGY